MNASVARITCCARTVPRSILYGVGAITLLYLGVQQSAQGILGPELATCKDAPLAAAIARLPGRKLVFTNGYPDTAEMQSLHIMGFCEAEYTFDPADTSFHNSDNAGSFAMLSR